MRTASTYAAHVQFTLKAVALVGLKGQSNMPLPDNTCKQFSFGVLAWAFCIRYHLKFNALIILNTSLIIPFQPMVN